MRNEFIGLLLALMVLLLLFVSACGRGASLAEPPSSPVPSPAAAPLSATPTPTPPVPPSATPVAPGGGKARPVIVMEIRGVRIQGEVIPFKNGQRLSLGDGLSLEMFIAPYPYSPTDVADLHLFPLRGETPVRGAKLEVTSDMTDMAHGPDPLQRGREVEDGDYGAPLEFYMFGNWEVYVIISHPQFDASLRLLLWVYPWRGR